MDERIQQPLIFPGSASTELTEEICGHLKIEPGKITIRRFADREIWVKIEENVRGADTYVVQSTYTPANEHLMELFFIIDALRRASAEKISAVIPYFGYARQDRKAEGRVALSAKLVANLILTAGANRVVTIDLHAGQIQGFFDIPLDHLLAAPVFINHVRDMAIDHCIVVAPDVGNVKMARSYADRLGCGLAIVDKRRPAPNVAEVANIIGKVKGCNVLMFDDLIDTGGTIVNAAEELLKHGAKKVFAFCTHGVFSRDALERIDASKLEQVIMTDTIPLGDKQPRKKIKVLSIGPLLGEAIKRIHMRRSISEMFEEYSYLR